MPDNQRNTEESKIMRVINRWQKKDDNGTKKYSSPMRYIPLKEVKNEVNIEYEELKKEIKKTFEIYKTKGKAKALIKYEAETINSKGIAKALGEFETSRLDKVTPRGNDQLGSKIIDPYLSYSFKIEIGNEEIAGFSEIGAIEISSELGEYYEGGRYNYPYHYIKKTKYSNIVLKKGITDDDYLYKWYQEVIMGKINKRDISIIVVPNNNVKTSSESYWLPDKTWLVLDAFPVKWTGTALNAGKGDVMIESLELVHSGIISL